MIIFYDLETTGLPRGGRKDIPGIIQIAAALYDVDGNEVDTFQTRVDPELPAGEWEDGAIKVTGVGPDDVQPDWPSMFSVAPLLSSFFRRANVLSGYNILGFDDDILYNNLVKYGYEKNFSWPMHRLDVMNVAKMKYKNTPAHKAHAGRNGAPPKLTTLYELLFEEQFEGAHDALNDVRATARCGFEIAKQNIEYLAGLK